MQLVSQTEAVELRNTWNKWKDFANAEIGEATYTDESPHIRLIETVLYLYEQIEEMKRGKK